MSKTDPADYGSEESDASNPSSLRRREDAERAAEKMLEDLKVTPDVISRLTGDGSEADDKDAAETWERIVRYATDVHLNIRWYDRAKRQQERRRLSWVILTSLIGITIIAFPFIYPLISYSLSGAPTAMQSARPSLLEIQASLIITALGSGWKLLSNLGDTSARIGIFWEAYADLKEELLSFQSAWRGKASDAEGRDLSLAFLAALDESLRRAHAITRKERLAFFDTYRSTATLHQSSADLTGELSRAREALDRARLQTSGGRADGGQRPR